jgi:AcrR family transcriptional regulator
LPEKKLSRKEREQRRRRREILEAASHLFTTHGYSDVGMKEIAAEAECAVGTLYRFFENKESVYAALVEDLLDRGQTELSAALDPSLDEAQQLRAWVETKQRLFQENMPLIRLLHEDVQLVGVAGRVKTGPGVQQRHQEVLRRLAAVFEAGMADGRFARIAPPEMLALALDNLTSVFWTEGLGRARPDPMETTPKVDPDSILQIFFAGLLAP